MLALDNDAVGVSPSSSSASSLKQEQHHDCRSSSSSRQQTWPSSSTMGISSSKSSSGSGSNGSSSSRTTTTGYNGTSSPLASTSALSPNSHNGSSATSGKSISPSLRPVEGKDPLSMTRPLQLYDRSAFEAAFPAQASSSSTSSTSQHALSLPSSSQSSSHRRPPLSSASTSSSSVTQTTTTTTSTSTSNTSNEDPFFYPLLCGNERQRLREFWYLTSGIHDDPDLALHLQNLLTIVKDLYDFDIAVMQFIDNDRSTSIDPNGWQEACCPRRETACAHTMLLQPGTLLTVSDFLSDPRFAKNTRLVEGQVRSYAGAPLAYTVQDTGESISLGSLCVFSFVNEKPPLTQAQRTSLSRFADLAMQAIQDRSRLRRESIQTTRHEVLSQLAKTPGLPSQTVEATLAALSSSLGGRASYVEAVDGCLMLKNVGKTPLTDFEDSIWENVEVIEDFIKYHNHESSMDFNPGCTVRALAVPLSDGSKQYLLVETENMRDIYDGIDTLFVQSCAMVIARSIQDSLLFQALEAKTSFLRNIQHAFRTSLNGVLSATDMLLGTHTLSQAHKGQAQKASSLPSLAPEGTAPLDLLRIIETSGRGLLTVVNHLIDLDAQEVALNFDICNIHDVEEEVLETIVQNSSKEKIKEILLISDNRLDGTTGDCIISDRLLLRQTIAALVQNAVEATNAGGMVKISIHLSEQPEGRQSLDIEVQDTGIGITEADQARILQPFEKVNTFTPNAGLGLSFASQYATSLGGSISLVESVPNAGSKFRLRLPNPILASSLQTARTRKSLPQGWTYWIQSLSDEHACDSLYGDALQSTGIAQAATPSEATVIVQPMLRIPSPSSSSCQPHRPGIQQVLLMLGWEEDYHSRVESRGDEQRTVYGRLPWTRSRLIATLLQAQQVLASANEAQSHALLGAPTRLQLCRRSTNQVRALLVDDNAMNLKILQAYCKKRTYEYQSACDGKEALEIYITACEAGSPPNICLLDLQMPVVDGITCAKMMRAYEQEAGLPRCPIVMVTAQSGDVDRRSSVEAGTDAYYVKPLRISTLDDIVARYVRT